MRLPGSVQGQAGWGSEQPGLLEGVPAHSRGGWNQMIFKGPFQLKPLYGLVIPQLYEKKNTCIDIFWWLCQNMQVFLDSSAEEEVKYFFYFKW